MNIVSRTATIRQTSQAGKKEPTILKEGARVQLVNNSIPSASPYLTNGILRSAAMVELSARASEFNGLREVLITVRNPFAKLFALHLRTTVRLDVRL
jgi:hypothetical protein